MKLYRGLKSKEYKELDEKILRNYLENWKKIIKIRESGNLKYPNHLDNIIKELFKHQYLVRQYFTDNKKVAERYAKAEGGLLLEIDVPINDLVQIFVLEFQNYTKRKESFEITYIVKGSDLVKNAKKWKLKIINHKLK